MSFGMEGSGNTLNITNTGSAIGTDVTGGTTGSVLFVGAGPVLAQDNANLSWDDTTKTMIVGAATSEKVKAHFGPAEDLAGVVEFKSADDMLVKTAGVSIKTTESNAAADTFFGLQSTTSTSASSGEFSLITGAKFITDATGATTIDDFRGINLVVNNNGASITDNFGLFIQQSDTSGVITNNNGIALSGIANPGGMNNYGINLGNVTGATNNYAIKTGLGLVDLGDMLQLSRGFTVGAGANVLPTPTVGMVARVTDSLNPTIGSTVASGGAAAALVWYNGTDWTVIGK